MLNARELKKIVKALPIKGYEIISEKLEGEFTPETIRKVLNEPKRYNKKIIDTAFIVIEEDQQSILIQKEKVKNLTA